MAWRWGFFSRAAQQTGGDFLLAHLSQVAGAEPLAVHGELRFSEEIAVVVYRFREPVPHFLYVTYGLSRTRSSAPTAGTQDELTLRIPDCGDPPAWPVHRLRRLARYRRSSGNPIEPGHYMDLRAPVCEGATLSGFIFANDPVVPLLTARTGRVRFLNAVPVTADELDAALCWDPLKFVGVLGDTLPLGVGDPARASLLIDAAFSRRLTSLTDRDGSSIAAVSCGYFAVDESGRIDLTTLASEHVLRAMKWRLGFDRSFAVVGEANAGWVRFVPDEEAAVNYGEDEFSGPHMVVGVDRMLRHEILAVLGTEPGTYRLSTAPLVFHVIDPAR
ncbi:suppressor of fused domain protein [Corynebacterium sp. p3-SID1145]|uniref:suppressor of fused domain protein n=1 Tax=unclassified Corynebacterium TaxID=2624378 RepID=UPI0021AA3EBD|nr:MULTISPECIES: suppressor of fused domain protein [unclassified Corynebacterium]MCT1453064.1 suppressor of fused domain protein [Corynebacterium sp. p3-SID1145]MCT1461994.1 suppressor of fused domain protein [Corynebacterium sp. p3-SID1140]